MRRVSDTYTKEEKLCLLNHSLSQVVVNAAEKTINEFNIVPSIRYSAMIKSMVPGAMNIELNPVSFLVATSDGDMKVTFKDGLFIED